MKNITKLTKEIKKRPKRTKERIQEEILEILKLSDRPMTTKDVANKVKTSIGSARKHLEFLVFAGDVDVFKRGMLSRWQYWKIKR